MTYIRPEVKHNEWKLSKHEFYVSYHFALQYREWKDKYNSMIGLSAINVDGMPHGNATSDPTSSQALKLSDYKTKIKIIEDTVKQTDESLYCWLIKAVTNEDISYNYLKSVMDIPCGKNEYYKLRRKFYFLLYNKLEIKK